MKNQSQPTRRTATAVLLAAGLISAGCAVDSNEATTVSSLPRAQAQAVTTAAPQVTEASTTTTTAPPVTEAPTTTTTAPSVPAETASQRNARKSAESYLRFASFSQSGLAKQLEYEGFSAEDAAYAVGTVTVDWNEQAAKTAANYLEISPFSRASLLKQLEYEGFTPEQAEYGVRTTGL